MLRSNSDPDGDPITARLVEGPAHAKKLTLRADGSFEYHPEAGFQRRRQLYLHAQDGELSSSEATVTIEVRGKNS